MSNKDQDELIKSFNELNGKAKRTQNKVMLMYNMIKCRKSNLDYIQEEPHPVLKILANFFFVPMVLFLPTVKNGIRFHQRISNNGIKQLMMRQN